jgi:hypothetical protein
MGGEGMTADRLASGIANQFIAAVPDSGISIKRALVAVRFASSQWHGIVPLKKAK